MKLMTSVDASCPPVELSKQRFFFFYLRRGLYSLKLRAGGFICSPLPEKVKTFLWERGQHRNGLAALFVFLIQEFLESDFLKMAVSG